MKFIMLFIATLATTPAIAQEPKELILKLEQLSNDKVISRIELYANDIDPNSSSVDDRYLLLKDGKPIAAPESLLGKLDFARRGYSYDHFTGGITEKQAQAVCRRGGPARGHILYVRYLTYREHAIESSEMRPVLSSGDCLFRHVIHPVKPEARTEALLAKETLLTIVEMAGE